MNKLLTLVVLACMTLPLVAHLAGCTTMVMDPQDHQRMLARNRSLEMKQIAEDWDYLWLQDEVSQLSPWYLPDPE